MIIDTCYWVRKHIYTNAHTVTNSKNDFRESSVKSQTLTIDDPIQTIKVKIILTKLSKLRE